MLKRVLTHFPALTALTLVSIPSLDSSKLRLMAEVRQEDRCRPQRARVGEVDARNPDTIPAISCVAATPLFYSGLVCIPQGRLKNGMVIEHL